MTCRPSISCLAVVALWACLACAEAAEVKVAVASNFAGPFARLAAEFMAATGHRVQSSTGATGKFYAQISNGAPFDVLLAADDETPRRLEQQGLAVKGSAYTYARGRMVLWSAQPGLVDEGGAVLRQTDIAHIAICDPRLAPYGVAAEQVLKSLGLYDAVKPRLVIAENVTQAWQFTATGNAELGFVALSQIQVPGKPAGGSYWLIPATHHAPLRQDAVLLQRAAANAAARALLVYIKSEPARRIIRSWGYELPH